MKTIEYMKFTLIRYCCIIAVFIFPEILSAKEPNPPIELWYDQPADEWMKSTPVGNGRLGAMVYGGVLGEIIAINESSMWSGAHDPYQEQPFGKEKMKELRQLFFDGKLVEGNQIAGEKLRGLLHSFGTHLPIGDLKLSFTYPEGKITNYKRSLNMNQALSTVSYKIGAIQYTRECFASNPDDAIILHMSANKKGSITADLSLDLLREASVQIKDQQITFEGDVSFPKQGPGGVSFIGKISVIAPKGAFQTKLGLLSVQNADELTIIIDVRTNYKNNQYKQLCEQTIKNVEIQAYKELKCKHIEDFSPLFDRVSLTLGNNQYDKLPTDKRWERIKSGATDPGLDAIFFQYGRYLLLVSSRENSPLPVALQGFFNDNLACNMSWTNDYHLDINTQQNYWISNIGNLSECNIPLFNYIKDLSIHGTKTAQIVYGCKGWTAHTTANIWGCTAPSSNIGWGLFPTASSWLASHLWSQYEYTLDKKFLAKTAYPLLKGNAEFLLDYMTEDPNSGHLVTGPSISPENNFRYQGTTLCASMMPTCDRVLAYEIFRSCIQAAQILNTDKAFSDSLKNALSKFPPIRLRVNGAIREWYEDYEEASPNHRHTSHLLALYPYNQISLTKTPELAAGARKTIEDRLSTPGWEDVEWSRANMICFYARLKDASKAHESIGILVGDFARENLLSISPAGIAGAPYDIFIFDGNAAGAAGIGEMLIQSHEGYIEFLPCLPEQWNKGSYKGLCVRGGAEVSADWNNSIISYASVKATVANSFSIKIPQNKNKPYKILLNGKTIETVPDTHHIVTISMKAGDLLEIK